MGGANAASGPCCAGLLLVLGSDTGPLLGNMAGQRWAVLLMVTAKPEVRWRSRRERGDANKRSLRQEAERAHEEVATRTYLPEMAGCLHVKGGGRNESHNHAIVCRRYGSINRDLIRHSKPEIERISPNFTSRSFALPIRPSPYKPLHISDLRLQPLRLLLQLSLPTRLFLSPPMFLRL